MDKKTEFKIKRFEEYVYKHFSFLEKLHFKKGKIKWKDIQYPQDMHVEIEYYSDTIFVTISWYLIESNIGIGICELNNGKKYQKYSSFGDKGYGRGIILYDLVEYLTKGKIKRPLPEILPKDNTSSVMKKVRESEKLINNNFENVIKDFANLLNYYAKEILEGDLSIFPIVQEYSKKKMEGEC